MIVNYTPFLTENNNYTSVDQTILNQFEASRSVIIPPKYKDFLRQFNGGIPIRHRYKLPDNIPQVGYDTLYIGNFNSLDEVDKHIALIEESGDIYGLKELLEAEFYTNIMLPIAYAGVGETFLCVGTQQYNIDELFWVLLMYDEHGKPYKPVRLENDFQSFLAKMID